MKRMHWIALMPVTAVCLLQAAWAEITIEQLTLQAGISPGPVAVRDMPQWHGARKILVGNMGVGLDDIAALDTDVEFIIVQTVDEAMQHAHEVDAIIGYCDADLVDAAERLVWVQIFYAGAERCLSTAAIASGDVLLTNMQKMSSPVIAEHAIAMVLSLARHLPQFARRMERADWDRSSEVTSGMTPLAGKTLLVVGLGGIGTQVARLGAALGMRVIGTRKSSRMGPDFVAHVGLSHELPEMAAEADFIVNALPLTEETTGLFDSGFFAAAKAGAIFVSVGRGKSVVTGDLVAALESGQLAGAGLDVVDPEPLPAASPLWKFENVIITPHVASAGGEYERHRVLLLENLRRYISGDHLLNVVDPEKGY